MSSDERVDNNNTAETVKIQRLCNEIQLFDLCELDKCSFKVNKFCTNAELLAAFERISDAEVVRSEAFCNEGLEDGDEAGDGDCDDDFEDDEFGDEPEYEDE